MAQFWWFCITDTVCFFKLNEDVEIYLKNAVLQLTTRIFAGKRILLQMNLLIYSKCFHKKCWYLTFAKKII